MADKSLQELLNSASKQGDREAQEILDNLLNGKSKRESFAERKEAILQKKKAMISESEPEEPTELQEPELEEPVELQDSEKPEESIHDVHSDSEDAVSQTINEDDSDSVFEEADPDVIPEKRTEETMALPRYRRKRELKDIVSVKNLPSEVIAACRVEFPDARSYADLLTAFVYRHSGKSFPVDDVVKDLVKDFDAHNASVERIQETQELVNKKLNSIADSVRNLNLAVSYLIYDRLGFRLEKVHRPQEIEFLEPGVEDVMDRLAMQGKRYKIITQQEQGRPQRKKKG